MDEKERAELNKTQADRDAVYLANGVISQEEVRQRLSLDRYSGYTMIDVDDVPEPQEQPLENTDKEEQDEEDRQAMDSLAFDWIDSYNRKHNDKNNRFERKNETGIDVVPNRYWSASMDIKELRTQAEKYYKDNLAGTETVNKKTGRVIKFSNSAFKKVKSFSADERKLRVVPYIKEIIENGDLQPEETKENTNKNEKWWRIKCDIIYGSKPETIGVNVREDQNGNLYYDHYIVNGRETLGSQSQSISPITNDSITENEYVVNIFFEDDLDNDPDGITNDEWVESDHPRDDDGKFSQKGEKLFSGHKLALEDLKKQAKKEASVLGVVKKLKENNDIAQYGEFAKGRESSVVWYWYNGGRKTQPTKEDVDSLVEENYKGYGDYKTYEELPDDVRYKFTSNDLTEDSSMWSKVKSFFAFDKKKGNPYRQDKNSWFGYAPVKELKLQKEEYAKIIGEIRKKATKLPESDVFSSYTSFNFKYLFWLNKETNDVIIYAKIRNDGEK